MAIRWRIAGLMLAAIVFVATLLGPVPGRDDFLGGLPLVLRACISAVSAFVAVWLYEGIYLGVLRIGSALFPAKSQTGERR
jgi:hypothetical protein